MVLAHPQLLYANVMHRRVRPKPNRFNYQVYYLACGLDHLAQLQSPFLFGVNTPGLLSFYNRDHGRRDDSDLGSWACNIFAEHGLNVEPKDVFLVCLPRVLGYVFNPVSFWFAVDAADYSIRAVLCEVNNTFGEHHIYLCIPEDGKRLTEHDWIEGQKLFHVSPFLDREGSYRFRFQLTQARIGVWLDYYDKAGEKTLLTAISGRLSPVSTKQYLCCFFCYPLVTLKIIILIHWQALKLAFKGIAYRTKPKQLEPRVSAVSKVTRDSSA